MAAPLRAGLGFILALTAWRVAMLSANRTDLFVDESQYWFWSRTLDWGYFSKPPLIAWVIRASTALGGAETAFWIRLPGPLLQGAAALAVMALAARLFGPRVGALSGASYALAPGASAGSMVIATDTVMLPFFALALLGFAAAARPAASGAAAGVSAGVSAGLGFLGKYAMAYFWACAALAALWRPALRPRGRWWALALAAFALVAAPNLAWNLANDLTTLSHTAGNAGSARGGLQWGALGAFLGAQFGVMGPVLFPAWLVALALAARRGVDDVRALLIAFSAPIMAVVCAQALRAEANPNWAAAACVAAIPLATALLAERAPALLRLSLALSLAAAVALPLAAAFPEHARAPGGPSLLRRMMGQDALAAEIAALARAQGARAIVADNRAILAALTHHLRDGGPLVFAVPPEGPALNHYQAAIALPPGAPGPLLLATEAGAPALPGWRLSGPVARWTPAEGFFRRRTLRAFRAEAVR